MILILVISLSIYCPQQWKLLYLLFSHLTGSGSESSLPDVSSVVASGRSVVISMGMESTTPSATVRQIHRNFSISPKTCTMMVCVVCYINICVVRGREMLLTLLSLGRPQSK